MKALIKILTCLLLVVIIENCHAYNEKLINSLEADRIKVQVISEVYPPYQIIDEKGELIGWSADKVKLIFTQANIDYSVDIYPWVRAYQLALTQSNTFIFSLLRTEERELSFQWVAKLCSIEFSFYRLKGRSDIELQSISDAKKYLIAAQKGQASTEYLLSLGFETGNNLSISYNNDNFVQMLIHDRVELIVLSLPYFQSLVLNNSPYVKEIEAIFSIDYLRKDLYLAGSLKTSPVLVDKLRRAYLELIPQLDPVCHD